MNEYFPHDYNARTDTAIRRSIMKFGFEAYGIYWALIEDLHNEDNSIDFDPDVIAFSLHTERVDVIEYLIKESGLFKLSDDGTFGSIRVKKNIEFREAKAEQARKAGKRSGEARRRRKEVEENERQLNGGSTSVEHQSNGIEQRKGNKEKKREDTRAKDFLDSIKMSLSSKGKQEVRAKNHGATLQQVNDQIEWFVNHFHSEGWFILDDGTVRPISQIESRFENWLRRCNFDKQNESNQAVVYERPVTKRR